VAIYLIDAGTDVDIRDAEENIALHLFAYVALGKTTSNNI